MRDRRSKADEMRSLAESLVGTQTRDDMADEDLIHAIGETSRELRDSTLGFEDLTDDFYFRLAAATVLRQLALQLAARGVNERAKRPLTAVESLVHVAAMLDVGAQELPILENADCDCDHDEVEHTLTGCRACDCDHLTGLPDLSREDATAVFVRALGTVPGAGPAELDPELAVRL